MAKVEFARDKLRTKFLKLMDEYEAMIVFLARMDQPLNGLDLVGNRKKEVGVLASTTTS